MAPRTVPILSAEDMCKGEFKKGDRCCLMGHANKFTDDQYRRLVIDVLTKVLIYEIRTETSNIPEFNDKRNRPLSYLARVWNRAMYRLGYTEGNPESRRLRRQRTPYVLGR